MHQSLKKILPIKDVHHYYIVGVSTSNDSETYKLLTVRLKDDDLKIIERYSSATFDDAFKSKLSKSYPILLHVDGDIVISKEVENKPNYRTNLIFKSDAKDFYFYEYFQDDIVFVSVCRKNKVDVYFKQLLTLNLFVLHIAIGPFVMVNLFSLLKGNSSIASEIDTLHLLNNKIESIEEKGTQKSIVINNETLKGNEIPLLASFFDYKFPNPKLEIDTSFLKENALEYNYKNWFKIAGIFALGFIMITLFVSHFSNSHYQNELAQKQVKYSNAKKTTTEINSLKEEIVLKEKILLNNRINNKNFITKYLSEISNSVPKAITLLEVSVFPKTKKIRPNEKINFFSNTLNIVGEAINDDAFNEWTKALKNQEWVNKMEIVEYNQSNRINTFKIKIIL